VRADNCVDTPNPLQQSTRGNVFGDACAPGGSACGFDADSDGFGDARGVSCDNCPGNAYVCTSPTSQQPRAVPIV
jgi:hypothetical protein